MLFNFVYIFIHSNSRTQTQVADITVSLSTGFYVNNHQFVKHILYNFEIADYSFAANQIKTRLESGENVSRAAWLNSAVTFC